MRRIVWVAIGAAGGVWAYRRFQVMSAQAREQGVVLTAQQAGLSAATIINTAATVATSSIAQARSLQASNPQASNSQLGAAAAAVLRRSDRSA